MKWCKRCESFKALAKFDKNCGCKDGYTTICKACLKAGRLKPKAVKPKVVLTRSAPYTKEQALEIMSVPVSARTCHYHRGV